MKNSLKVARVAFDRMVARHNRQSLFCMLVVASSLAAPGMLDTAWKLVFKELVAGLVHDANCSFVLDTLFDGD